jgi:uracil-DNA glycosylase
LTTIQTKSNVHTKLWTDFSKDFISYINDNLTDVVFLVWGRDAYNICKNVNTTRHHLIVSSHPSPLSVEKTFSVSGKGKNKNIKQTYPSFINRDHFGLANEWLISKGKTPIIWHIA